MGHQFSLQTNVVMPLPHKPSISHNLCKHQLKGWTFQPENLAALAGNLADTAKSNMSLHGLPQQIMKAAAWGVLHNTKLGWNKARCWGTSTSKPQGLLKATPKAIDNPIPRVLRPGNTLVYVIQSDASDHGWGARHSLIVMRSPIFLHNMNVW